MKKSIAIIFTIFTLCLLAFSFAGCAKEQPISLTDKQESFYNSWLSYIDDETAVNKIAILGSHDSGTSQMKHAIYKNMTITQDYTIAEQLKVGCRYFDIRVNKKKNGDLNIFHGPDTTGCSFESVAKDIVEFIKNNPSEFLILDFQHFNNQSQADVITALKDTGILEYAYHNNTPFSDTDLISRLKLKHIRGKVLITWGSNEANSNDYQYLFRRNNDSCTLPNTVLDSYYNEKENKKASEDFIKEAIPKYMQHIHENPKVFTVLQGQLTLPTLIGNLKKLEGKHNANMSSFIRSIEEDKTYINDINIIMRDFIGSDLEKTNSVLHLNIAKGFVKSEYIDLFESITAKT